MGVRSEIRGMVADRLTYWAFRLDPLRFVESTTSRRVSLDEVVRWLRHIDRLDEIPGARDSLPAKNPLWDAATALEAGALDRWVERNPPPEQV